jgi:hypothetical protein
MSEEKIAQRVSSPAQEEGAASEASAENVVVSHVSIPVLPTLAAIG